MPEILNKNFASKIAGASPPRSFALDATILDYQYVYEVNLDDTKRNRIEFVFPDGMNKLDLFEECRAMRKLDDFDTMFDLTMQLLENRDVVINYFLPNGEKEQLCMFHVTDKYQDLRGVEEIDKWPILVTWLTEFVGGMLLKKCPMPGTKSLPEQASKKDKKRKQ